MALMTFTKINSIYKRYAFDSKSCPNQKWLKFRNKIILGDFSDDVARYLFDCSWEAYSKINGTNSKIVFYPSTGRIVVGGKTDKASSQHGQFEMLEEIGNNIKDKLCEMFPKESARFAPVKEGNKIQWSDDITTTTNPSAPKMYNAFMEEVPIYIYGEYFGEGVQKCGGRYMKKGNAFRVFDICQQGWWTPKEVRDSICSELGLDTVPYLGNMTLREIERMVKNGFTTRFEGASDPTLIEEGIVARPTIPLLDSRGNRIIVKVKYCDYKEWNDVRREFTDEEFNEFDKWYHEEVESLYGSDME